MRGRPGWNDGQMEQAYGRCRASLLHDTSGEISGPKSHMHAESNRHSLSLARLQS